MRNQLAIVTALCIAAQFSVVAYAEENDLTLLDWFQGEWAGVGREGEDGEVAGNARLHVFLAPEGVLATTFEWRNPADNHIHYAFTVFHETDEGVTGRGIHHGRDFETFEDHPWEFRAVSLSSGQAVFECVAHCRAKSVTYKLLENGSLEERWTPLKESDPVFIVHYKRSNQ